MRSLKRVKKYSFKHNAPTRAVAGKSGRAIPGQGIKVIMNGTTDDFDFTDTYRDNTFSLEHSYSLVKEKVARRNYTVTVMIRW
jgi:hypothetical protein